MQKTENCWCGG